MLGAISIAAFFYFKDKKDIVIEPKTVRVVNGNITTTITATGTVEPITQVEVGTQVSGVVEKIYVDYNSVVTEGQLIAELDKTNLNASLTQMQASYDNAVSQRNFTKTIYDRQKVLYENQVISKSDFDEATYNYETAKGTVTQRYSDLQSARTNLSYANIYSPIDGVVLSRAIDEGQTVAASLSTPTLFTIAQDLKEMQVEADVDEADIGQVKEGQRVTFTVDAYLGETFEGEVTQVRLDPTVTSNVVTYTVVIKATNPDLKLKPGLTATISIFTLEMNDLITTEAKAINYQPEEAILTSYNTQHNLAENTSNFDEKATTVWVLSKDRSIVEKEIELGVSDGVNVEIKSGLSVGDKLVYSLKSISKSEVSTPNKSNSNESPFMPSKPPGRK